MLFDFTGQDAKHFYRYANFRYPDNIEKGEEFLKSLTESTLEKLTVLDFGSLDPNEYLSTILDIKYNFTYIVSNSNSGKAQMELAITEMGICYYYNSAVALYSQPR